MLPGRHLFYFIFGVKFVVVADCCGKSIRLTTASRQEVWGSNRCKQPEGGGGGGVVQNCLPLFGFGGLVGAHKKKLGSIFLLHCSLSLKNS